MPLFQKKQIVGDSADASHAARLADEAARLWETLEARNALAAEIALDRAAFASVDRPLSGVAMLGGDWRRAMDQHVLMLTGLSEALATKEAELAAIDREHGGVSAMQQRIADLGLAARQRRKDNVDNRLKVAAQTLIFHGYQIEAAVAEFYKVIGEAAKMPEFRDSGAVDTGGAFPFAVFCPLDNLNTLFSAVRASAAIRWGSGVLAEDDPLRSETLLERIRRAGFTARRVDFMGP